MKRLFLLIASSALLLSACSTSEEGSSSIEVSQSSESSSSSGEVTSSSEEVNPYVEPQFDINFKVRERVYDEVGGTYSYSSKETVFRDALKRFNNVPAHYYNGTFTNKLNEPGEVVHNFDELTYLFDYSSFYKIASFEFSFDTSYLLMDEEGEIRKAFWNARMTNHVVGFNFRKSEDKYVIDLSYNDYAATAINKGNALSHMVNPFNITLDVGEKITSIPYEGSDNLDVYNSDQLLYALYNNYKPVMVEGSAAKAVYDKAVSVLKEIITNNMNDLQKIYAIHEYLASSCVYDTDGDDLASSYFEGEEIYPAKVASTFVSFFAEGPLLYHQGACAGFAKAESLMMALLNINHVRVTAGGEEDLMNTNYCKSEERGYWYHEYNYYIAPNGKYYVCDPTYVFGGSYVAYNKVNYNFPSRTAPVALLRSTWGRVYRDTYDIIDNYDNEKIGTEELEFGNQIYINNNVDIIIRSEGELFEAFAAAEAAAAAYKERNNIPSSQKVVFRCSLYANINDSDWYELDSISGGILSLFEDGRIFAEYHYDHPYFGRALGFHLVFAK